MKQTTLLGVLPLIFAASPALAQAPAAPAPAPVTAPEPPATPAPAEVAPAAAPPPESAPPPTALPPPVAVPLEATRPEADAAPDKLTVAKTGFFQPSANLQAWVGTSHIATNPDDEWASTFRVRRAEIRAKGEIVPKTIGYLVMFDVARLLDFQNKNVPVTGQEPAPTKAGSVTVLQPASSVSGSALFSGANTSILQDVALTWINDYADISIGQFKIPVSLEGAGSAARLYFPERALVSRAFGDRRDLGIKAEKKFEKFGYTLGLYNGEGQNKLDSNDQKDLALRLEVYPVKDLTAAVVGYVALGERELPNTKDRLEGDIKLDKYNILLQAEYIRAWDKTATTRVNGQGFYVVAGYTFFDKLQPVVRVGSLDPDMDNDEHGATERDNADETTSYEFGANYYFKSHDAKLQLAGTFFDPEQASAHTRFELILAAQVAF